MDHCSFWRPVNAHAEHQQKAVSHPDAAGVQQVQTVVRLLFFLTGAVVQIFRLYVDLSFQTSLIFNKPFFYSSFLLRQTRHAIRL
jgi:hypothetical protein